MMFSWQISNKKAVSNRQIANILNQLSQQFLNETIDELMELTEEKDKEA